ncbi:MAG: DJ-1/PfpI family protein [Planctomycetia bacterium]|nr:DJ-1/PfpI family protein [Planctomycetia bacterium]
MDYICRNALSLIFLVAAAIWTAAPLTAAPPQDTDKPNAHVVPTEQKDSRTIGIVLYPKFELLDVYGPAEILGNLGSRMKMVMVAQKAGPIASVQGPQVVADCSFEDCPPLDLLLVPGGFGTLSELNNAALLDWLRARASKTEIVMSVCSGSAILAKAGLLDGRRATSNKRFFQLAVDQGPKVQWVKEARWVDDGDRVTSSGVSAGIDMALHVVERLYGTKTAELLADGTEYQWHRDATKDPFARPTKSN